MSYEELNHRPRVADLAQKAKCNLFEAKLSIKALSLCFLVVNNLEHDIQKRNKGKELTLHSVF